MLLSGQGLSTPGAIEQLHWNRLEIRVTSSSLVALGLIADFDPEVLWIDSVDDELTVDDILEALTTPRQIRPLSVVLSLSLNAELPLLDSSFDSQTDEVHGPWGNSYNPARSSKVTKLERQVIQREHEILDSFPHALLVVDSQLTLWKVNRKFLRTT